jgi:hypothetical protein
MVAHKTIICHIKVVTEDIKGTMITIVAIRILQTGCI